MGTSQSSTRTLPSPKVPPPHRIHSADSLVSMDRDHNKRNDANGESCVLYADSLVEDQEMLRKLLEIYDCGKIIGQGASGQVFEVTLRSTGKKYACKVVHKNKRMNDNLTMRTEAELLKRIQHDRIANMYEIFETSISTWFILEYASGGTLQTAIASGPRYTEAFVAAQFRQVLEGVQYLHSMGIVHRDLKPDNILCSITHSPSGQMEFHAKITDFGLAAMLPVKAHKSEGNLRSLSSQKKELKAMKRIKTLKERWGTPEFFAPEVYQKAYGPQVDVWALGCYLYELLVGEAAFPQREREGSNLERYLLNGGKRIKRDFELRMGWGYITAEAKDMVLGMLHRDPVKRLSIEECLSHPWITGELLSVSLKKDSAAAVGVSSRYSSTAAAAGAGNMTPETSDRIPIIPIGATQCSSTSTTSGTSRSFPLSAANFTTHKTIPSTTSTAATIVPDPAADKLVVDSTAISEQQGGGSAAASATAGVRASAGARGFRTVTSLPVMAQSHIDNNTGGTGVEKQTPSNRKHHAYTLEKSNEAEEDYMVGGYAMSDASSPVNSNRSRNLSSASGSDSDSSSVIVVSKLSSRVSSSGGSMSNVALEYDGANPQMKSKPQSMKQEQPLSEPTELRERIQQQQQQQQQIQAMPRNTNILFLPQRAAQRLAFTKQAKNKEMRKRVERLAAAAIERTELSEG